MQVIIVAHIAIYLYYMPNGEDMTYIKWIYVNGKAQSTDKL